MPHQFWFELSHGQVVTYISSRRNAIFNSEVAIMRAARLVAYVQYAQWAKNPKPIEKWMELPGDKLEEKKKDEPISKEAAIEMAKAFFIALGGKLDENGNTVK